MNNVLLISENVLKSYSYIGENVQANELRYAILASQNIEIRESLGDRLYAKILNLVDTDTINLVANIEYKRLLDEYIQPALISYSIFRALDNFIAKFLSIGLVSNSSEQGQPIEYKTFLMLKNNVKDDADYNNNTLRRYLVFHTNLYPEYNQNSRDEIWPVQQVAFQSPISLPGTRRGWFSENTCMIPQFYGPVPKNNNP